MKKIYKKIKETSEFSKGLITYSYKDDKGIIYPLNYITVDFRNNKENIKKMNEIKKQHGDFFFIFQQQ